MRAAAAVSLDFVSAPTEVQAGTLDAVRVAVVDAFGNTADSSASVTLVLDSDTDAELGGTTTVSAVGGVATFDTLELGQAGRGYVLVARSEGLVPCRSRPSRTTPSATW